MEGSVMVQRTPRHMRDEAVARIGSSSFEDLQQAVLQAENNTVVLVADYSLAEPLYLRSSNTTLDLNGHTLKLLPPFEDTSRVYGRSCIYIQAPGVKICNGSIHCSSGARQAICISTSSIQEAPSTAFLGHLEIESIGKSIGVACLSGGVILTHTRIVSTGIGIHLQSPKARVGLEESYVKTRRCGVLLQGGKLLASNSTISSHWSCGIFANSGNACISHTTVRAYRRKAIATQELRVSGISVLSQPYIDIRNNSEIHSFPSFAIDLLNGSVVIRDSEARSMEHTTVRVGSPNPTGIVRFEARRNALITSWKADGIIYYSGTMQLDGAIFNCDTGEDVVQVQIPEQVVDEKSDLESDVSETRAYAPYDEASEEAPAQEELLQEEPVLEELSEEEPVLEEPDLEKESYTEQAFDQGLGFDDEFQEEYEEVVAEADTQPEEPSTPETSAQGDVSYDATQDLAPKPIERIDIHHVHLHLHATRPIRFSARVSSDSSNVKIDFEQWTNGSSIITSLNPETPFGGSKYRYIIALRTEAGYAFSKRFQLYYRGKRVTYSAMISNDLRTAMIDWNLTSTVSKPTIAQRMFL